MKQKITFIALRTTRVNDSMSILNAYSLQNGRLSFALSASGGREARRRRALLMPLGIVECQADLRPGRDIHFMDEPRAVVPLERLYSHPVKNAVAMFVAEFLSVVLRECVADEPRFRFLADAICRLEAATTTEAANFHIVFLIRLGRFLGVEPDFGSYREGYLFDMTDGIFKPVRALTPVSRFLNADDSRRLTLLARINFDNAAHFRFDRTARNLIIGNILEFYSMHVAPLGSLKSLDVLRMLF